MAKEALSATRTNKRTQQPALAEYSRVSLCHDIQSGGTTFAAGTQGVIVHRHGDGVGYEVEFERPVFRVVTLTERDIRPVHG
jgi:hypothetical protein